MKIDYPGFSKKKAKKDILNYKIEYEKINNLSCKLFYSNIF